MGSSEGWINEVNYKISIRGGSSAKKQEGCCCSQTMWVLPKRELWPHRPSLRIPRTCSQSEPKNHCIADKCCDYMIRILQYCWSTGCFRGGSRSRRPRTGEPRCRVRSSRWRWWCRWARRSWVGRRWWRWRWWWCSSWGLRRCHSTIFYTDFACRWWRMRLRWWAGLSCWWSGSTTLWACSYCIWWSRGLWVLFRVRLFGTCCPRTAAQLIAGWASMWTLWLLNIVVGTLGGNCWACSVAIGGCERGVASVAGLLS